LDLPPDFLPRLQQAALTPVPAPNQPSLFFNTTAQALSHNARKIANANHDLSQQLQNNSDTTLHFGSEFGPTDQLEMVLGGHPRFGQLQTILTAGMDYWFKTELSKSDRLIELTQMLERGNHKSSVAKPDIVNKLLLKDVHHGFSIPIPPETVPLIAGALVQPFGLAQQFTLTELGERVAKYRLTQDLSFSLSQENCSVNLRIDMSQHNEIIYGWCLSRILHYIVALRLAYPGNSILIAKYDYRDETGAWYTQAKPPPNPLQSLTKSPMLPFASHLEDRQIHPPGASSAKWSPILPTRAPSATNGTPIRCAALPSQ
jgi:hypothetical protein